MVDTDAGEVGGPQDAGDGRSGASEDRGREGDDLEIFYRNLGTRDRVLICFFLFLIAFPFSWIRVGFVMLICAAEWRLGSTEIQLKGYTIKAWERRAVSSFAVVLAMSKIVWWSIGCLAFVIGIRTMLIKMTPSSQPDTVLPL